MRIKDIGEIGLIERLIKGIRLDRSVVIGAGDDTAVIKWTKDKYLLFTCDMLIEDIHFCLGKARPFDIGWKALARNISDIAAMGGVARYAVVSAGISPEMPVGLADGIYKGIKSAANKFKVNLVGGDTSKSKKLVIDISLLGEVEKANLVTRHGARKGDMIFVTGSLGGSIKARHLKFIPRIAESRKLVQNFKINSMIDISDGLTLDLWRILKASSVGARIYEKAIPVSRDADSLEEAMAGGEDFELLFTMSRKESLRLLKAARSRIRAPITPIGEITGPRSGYRLIKKDGTERVLKPKGYLHF